jgi:hypothetical protein
MAATAWHSADEQFEQIVKRAAVEGFELVQFETPHGQLVWAWRRGDDARPGVRQSPRCAQLHGGLAEAQCGASSLVADPEACKSIAELARSAPLGGCRAGCLVHAERGAVRIAHGSTASSTNCSEMSSPRMSRPTTGHSEGSPGYRPRRPVR